MKRLEQFKYLSERAQQSLEIPDDATIINITDHFKEGGPIVVLYSLPMSEDKKARCRERRQRAIESMLDDVLERERAKQQIDT